MYNREDILEVKNTNQVPTDDCSGRPDIGDPAWFDIIVRLGQGVETTIIFVFSH